MDSGRLLRRARHRAGLTQRQLARRAGTSHATIAMYESGAKVPRVDTLDRILRAAGYSADVTLEVRADGGDDRRSAKGRELVRALELAATFPARRPARHLPPPVTPRPATSPGRARPGR